MARDVLCPREGAFSKDETQHAEENPRLVQVHGHLVDAADAPSHVLESEGHRAESQKVPTSNKLFFRKNKTREKPGAQVKGATSRDEGWDGEKEDTSAGSSPLDYAAARARKMSVCVWSVAAGGRQLGHTRACLRCEEWNKRILFFRETLAM